MPDDPRLAILKDMPPRPEGRYVHYWMQQAMRAEGNLALDHAVTRANELGLPVVVSFGLTGAKSPPYPDANARHYTFLLQGLAEVEGALRARGIGFTVRRGSPVEVTLAVAKDAALLVCDLGYLKPQRTWQAEVVKRLDLGIERIETDAIVPIEVASDKHEFAARTLRPKIARNLDRFLQETRSPKPRHRAPDDLAPRSDIDLSDVGKVVGSLKIDHEVGAVSRFTGGLKAARANLHGFIANGLPGYKESRSEPAKTSVTHLSPYLHFGQIAPLEIVLAVKAAKAGKPDHESFDDEIIVRRELAMNHVWFQPDYDRYEDAVPRWAREALDRCRDDPRPYSYSRAQLEAGKTHDRYWNAAQKEMRETGYMHNRLRMYWGKKIVEWTKTPEEAYRLTLALNNKFFVDGRDANSFTNVAWLFGLHDRPWFRRPIFGTVRYLGDNTLRKFDAEGYVRSVDELAAAEKG